MCSATMRPANIVWPYHRMQVYFLWRNVYAYLPFIFWEKILSYKKQFFVKRHLYKKEGLSLMKRKLPNGAELWLLKCWQQKSTRYSIEKKSRSVFKFLNNFRPFTRPIEKKLNRIRFFCNYKLKRYAVNIKAKNVLIFI